MALGQRAQIAQLARHHSGDTSLEDTWIRAGRQAGERLLTQRRFVEAFKQMARVESLKELTLSFIVRNRALLGACPSPAAAFKAQSCQWTLYPACPPPVSTIRGRAHAALTSSLCLTSPNEKPLHAPAGDLGDIDLDSATAILDHCNVEQLRTIENETAWGVIPHSVQSCSDYRAGLGPRTE